MIRILFVVFCGLLVSNYEIIDQIQLENGVLESGFIEKGKYKYYEISILKMDKGSLKFNLQIERLLWIDGFPVEVEMFVDTTPPKKVYEENEDQKHDYTASRYFRHLSCLLEHVHSKHQSMYYVTVFGKHGNTNYTIFGHYNKELSLDSVQVQNGVSYSIDGRRSCFSFFPNQDDSSGFYVSVTPIAIDTKLTLESKSGGYDKNTLDIPNMMMVSSEQMKISKEWIGCVDSSDHVFYSEFDISFQTFHSHSILSAGIPKYSFVGGIYTNSSYFKILSPKSNFYETDGLSILVSGYPKTYSSDQSFCLNLFVSQNTEFPSSQSFEWATKLDNIWYDVTLFLHDLDLSKEIFIKVSSCEIGTAMKEIQKFMIVYIIRSQPVFLPMQSSDSRPIIFQKESVNKLVFRTSPIEINNFTLVVDSCSNQKFQESHKNIEIYDLKNPSSSSSFVEFHPVISDSGFSDVYKGQKVPDTMDVFFLNFDFGEKIQNFSFYISTFEGRDRFGPIIPSYFLSADDDDDDDCDLEVCNFTVSVENYFKASYDYNLFHVPIHDDECNKNNLNIWTGCSINTNSIFFNDGLMVLDSLSNHQIRKIKVGRDQKYLINLIVEDPKTHIYTPYYPISFSVTAPEYHIKCFGKPQKGRQVCEGHGKCISENTCRCSFGYFGKKCQFSVANLLIYIFVPSSFVILILLCCFCILLSCIFFVVIVCCCCISQFFISRKKVEITQQLHDDVDWINEKSPLLGGGSQQKTSNNNERFRGNSNGVGRIDVYDRSTKRYVVVFEGEFKNGIKEGKGTEYFIPASNMGHNQGLIRFQGIFVNNLRHGKGIEYSIVNEKTLSGVWKNGQLVTIDRDFVDLPKIKISDFKIDFVRDKIGSGSEGDVFKITYNDQPAALKILRNPTFINNKNNNSNEHTAIQRQNHMFARSQKIWSKISDHPFILDLYAWTGVMSSSNKKNQKLQQQQLKGCITELCEKSLTEAILEYSRKKQESTVHLMNWKSTLRIMYSIAIGMEFLHDRSIMHRDLKISNILLDAHENPKICDFEFARYDDLDWKRDRFVRNVSVLGTPACLAPEVVMKRVYTKSCDVFSYSVVLYCLYYGVVDPYCKLEKCSGCGKDLTISELFIHQHVGKCGLRPLIYSCNSPERKEHTFWILDLIKQCWKHKPEERPSFKEIVRMFKNNSRKVIISHQKEEEEETSNIAITIEGNDDLDNKNTSIN